MPGRTLDVQQYARFGERLYRLAGTYQLKKDATESAAEERSRGGWTRITQGANGWQLWVRV